jgi:hypothetical protein
VNNSGGDLLGTYGGNSHKRLTIVLGHLKSIEWPRWGSGRYLGGQAEIREDLGDHGGSSMAAIIFKVPPPWERDHSIQPDGVTIQNRSRLSTPLSLIFYPYCRDDKRPASRISRSASAS